MYIYLAIHLYLSISVYLSIYLSIFLDLTPIVLGHVFIFFFSLELSDAHVYEPYIPSSGAGRGGYVAAIKGAQLGLKVVCVEKRGVCLQPIIQSGNTFHCFCPTHSLVSVFTH